MTARLAGSEAVILRHVSNAVRNSAIGSQRPQTF